MGTIQIPAKIPLATVKSSSNLAGKSTLPLPQPRKLALSTSLSSRSTMATTSATATTTAATTTTTTTILNASTPKSAPISQFPSVTNQNGEIIGENGGVLIRRPKRRSKKPTRFIEDLDKSPEKGHPTSMDYGLVNGAVSFMAFDNNMMDPADHHQHGSNGFINNQEYD